MKWKWKKDYSDLHQIVRRKRKLGLELALVYHLVALQMGLALVCRLIVPRMGLERRRDLLDRRRRGQTCWRMQMD